MKNRYFMSQKVDEILNKLTLEEKAKLLCGASPMASLEIKEKDLKAIHFSDGPHGVRKEDSSGDSLGGIAKSFPSTCFPVDTNLANTWNKHLAYLEGTALAKECKHYDVNVLLGPAINIKRNPKCGRNFEYFSEDPLLTGYLAYCYINGLQNEGVGACPKHFACNNNENHRFNGNSIVDERALREIYLKPFEIAVKHSFPKAIMTSYNKINDIHASENDYLQNKILRDEWGFNGVSLTDWGGVKDRVLALKTGCDLEMPGMVYENVEKIINAYNNKELDIDTINKSVRRILELQESTAINHEEADFKNHYELAEEIAIQSAVLLKNENTLPLHKEKHYLFVGELFDLQRYQGSGSSLLNPYIFKEYKDVLNEHDIGYEYKKGYTLIEDKVDRKLEDEVISSINNQDAVILFVGQNDFVESEGFDRETLHLPHNQISLIKRLSESTTIPIVLVLFGGSMVILPNTDKISSILYMGLPGEAGAEACCSLLFGDSNPSGRLSESWINKEDDIPFMNEFDESANSFYKESIYVGYRYLTSNNVEVRYPFGYGLSYSTFTYNDVMTRFEDNKIVVTISVTNQSDIVGDEVIELFIHKKDSVVNRPLRELKAFEKVHLEAHETRIVNVVIEIDDLKVWNVDQFKLEKGEYIIQVCKDANTVILETPITLVGESLKEDTNLMDYYYHTLSNLNTMIDEDFEVISKRKITPYVIGKWPYTLETPVGEYDTFYGRILKNAMINVGKKQAKNAKKIKDERLKEREMKAGIFISKLMANNSLRSLCFSSSGQFQYKTALALLELANGRVIKALKLFTKK